MPEEAPERSLLKIRASSACMKCGIRHVVDIEQRPVARAIGTFSLAGVQTKVSASEKWIWYCTNCKATGNTVSLPLREIPELVGCGHHMLLPHENASAGDHTLSVCAGCCRACQRRKDERRWI